LRNSFNRCEEDFDTLLDYNNYLNDVEDITFNLVNKIDVAETERKLVAYAEANKQAISNNMARESQTKLSRESIKAHENDLTRLRREAAQIEDEQRLREREESRRDLIEKLATGDASAVEAVKAAQTVKLKKTSARKAMQGAQNNLEGKKADMASRSGAADSAFEIKGLKKRVEPQPEKAYDPFADLSFQPKYFVLQDRYAWHWLDDARKEPKYAAGGYNVQDYCARALCDAFSGLGVFVEDRDASKETSGASFGVAAKSTDENITTKSNADDVFV
jgi:CDK-activating kinase assembly factor MAT1